MNSAAIDTTVQIHGGALNFHKIVTDASQPIGETGFCSTQPVVIRYADIVYGLEEPFRLQMFQK